MALKDTHIGTREMMTLKNSVNVEYSVNLKLIMYKSKHSSFMVITYYIREKAKMKSRFERQSIWLKLLVIN